MLTFGVVRRVAVHSDQRRTWLNNIQPFLEDPIPSGCFDLNLHRLAHNLRYLEFLKGKERQPVLSQYVVLMRHGLILPFVDFSFMEYFESIKRLPHQLEMSLLHQQVVGLTKP